ncbi:hypothetical protein ABS71_13605 [bacterium SCN 62-11]|nr:DUF4394 domain-containing protein [Candidatus Eremiobacteraeota bacterium]ODT64062.1 MAG: hypothetical protein ABS71_13605 [bacterium SCN 62-11]
MTLGLAALMTFGCGNVFDSSNGTNENVGNQFLPNQTAGNPFKIWAVDTTGQLFSFPSDNPSFVTNPVAITGTTGNERIIAIDCRPRTGKLYGVGVSGRVYWIDKGTAAATLVGTGAVPVQVNADIDFNPVVDRIRQEAGVQNVRVHPGTGVVTLDTNLTIQPGGAAASAVACAYTNPEEAPQSTELFVFDSVTNRVYRQANPNNGVLTEVGQLPFEIGSNVGFDIGPGNVGFASVQKLSDGFSTLLKFDPANGAATVESRIASANPVKSIAVDLNGPTLKRFVGIDANKNLVRFNSDNPANLISSNAITGIAEKIVGCDFSAGGSLASGLKVLAVSDVQATLGQAKIYSVDLTPGVNFAKATLVSSVTTTLPDPTAVQFGVDIIPGTGTTPGPGTMIVTAAAGTFTGRRVLSGQSTQVFGIVVSSGATTPLPNYGGYIPALGFDRNFLGGGEVFGYGINFGQTGATGSEVPFLQFVNVTSAGIQNGLSNLAQVTTETSEIDIAPDDSAWFVGPVVELRTAETPGQPFPVDGSSTLFQVSRPALAGVPMGRVGGNPIKSFAIIPALEQNADPAPRLTEAPWFGLRLKVAPAPAGAIFFSS